MSPTDWLLTEITPYFKTLYNTDFLLNLTVLSPAVTSTCHDSYCRFKTTCLSHSFKIEDSFKVPFVLNL